MQPIDNSNSNQPIVTTPANAQISFNTVKNQVLSNCTACHSNFSDYNTVTSKINTIQQMVQGGHGNLTNDQLDLLNAWISGGMAQ